MTYKLNGKSINIPDSEIKNLMTVLDISEEEAIDTWLSDNDYVTNEEQEALIEKTKGQRHYEKSDKPRKASTRERKVDDEKKTFLDGFRIFVEDKGGEITSLKNEAEFSFTFGENEYTVKLVKHRPPKK